MAPGAQVKFVDSRGEVCDSEDIENATVEAIDPLASLIAEMTEYVGRNRIIKVQPYTFNRWLRALTQIKKGS